MPQVFEDPGQGEGSCDMGQSHRFGDDQDALLHVPLAGHAVNANDFVHGLTQLKLAARDLTRNHTRTLISLSAIAFGVMALLLAGGFIEWIFWAIGDAAIYNTGLGHAQISRPGFRATGFADPKAFCCPTPARTSL